MQTTGCAQVLADMYSTCRQTQTSLAVSQKLLLSCVKLYREAIVGSGKYGQR